METHIEIYQNSSKEEFLEFFLSIFFYSFISSFNILDTHFVCFNQFIISNMKTTNIKLLSIINCYCYMNIQIISILHEFASLYRALSKMINQSI
ncbi:hypothetical protein pb186bvf_003216 [Paramecium bursaria]